MSSRNEIPARESGLCVVVGWDNPVMSFFAQVERIQTAADPRDPILLWLGASPGDGARPAEDLAGPLAPYAELTAEHIAQLRADRVADADRAPTALQHAMLARMGRRS